MCSLDDAYESLSKEVATAYRRIGQWPGSHLTAGTVAALVERPPMQATDLMKPLVNVGLAERTEAGWVVPDRDHAQAMAIEHDSTEVRQRALVRALTHTLRDAAEADYALFPQRTRLGRAFYAATLGPPAFRSQAAALEHLKTEVDNVIAGQEAAVQIGRPDLGWQLGEVLWTYLQTERKHPRWVQVTATAAACARECRDPEAHARMLSLMAQAQRDRCENASVWETVRQMRELTAASGDRMGVVTALEHTAVLLLEQDDPHAASQALKSALDILEEMGGHERSTALIHRRLGTAYGKLSRHEDAAVHFSIAFNTFGELYTGADWHQKGRVLTEHATSLLEDADDPNEAVGMLRHAIGILDDCHRPHSLAHAHRMLAQTLKKLGQFDQARQHADEALTIYQDADVRPDHENYRRTRELAAGVRQDNGVT